MRTVTATELRAKLGEILDAASAGEKILIERDHKPLAYLISPEEEAERDAKEREEQIEREIAALHRLVEFGKRMKEKYPDPDDGLTYVEWRRKFYEERADKIDRAAAGLPQADRLRDRAMTASLVVDASAMIAIIRDEPERVALEQVLEARRRAGVTLLAPAGFWLEIVNSLVRRHGWSSAEVLEVFSQIDALRIFVVDIGRSMLVLTLDLAERYGLTACDANYLAVALTEDAELLTLDADLAAAASDRAVTIEGGHRLNESPTVYEHAVTWPRYREASAYLATLRARGAAGRSCARRSRRSGLEVGAPVEVGAGSDRPRPAPWPAFPPRPRPAPRPGRSPATRTWCGLDGRSPHRARYGRTCRRSLVVEGEPARSTWPGRRRPGSGGRGVRPAAGHRFGGCVDRRDPRAP